MEGKGQMVMVGVKGQRTAAYGIASRNLNSRAPVSVRRNLTASSPGCRAGQLALVIQVVQRYVYASLNAIFLWRLTGA